MEKTIAQSKTRPAKLPRGYMAAWSTRGISLGVYMVLFMQITYFATESLGMDVSLVGILLLASRIFDGFTDAVVGFVIDRTHTRFGKARPYELMVIPLWICVILFFGAQAGRSVTGKAVYFFVLYTLITGVFQTCLNGSEGILLRRSLKEGELHAKVVSFTGVILVIFCGAANILLPQLMNTWGKESGGWFKIALVYGIPMLLLGVQRFFFIKETAITVDAEKEKFGFWESVTISIKNKYVLLLGAGALLVNIINNVFSTVGSYYFNYIMGDLGLLSIYGDIWTGCPLLPAAVPPGNTDNRGYAVCAHRPGDGHCG